MTAPAELSTTSIVRERLNTKAEQALKDLESRTSHSWRNALDHTKVLPDSVDLAGAPSLSLFIRSSSGPHVTDIDGTRFLDLCMGFGALILGHTHSAVHNAIVEQASRGWQFGLPNVDQTEFAQLIQFAGPANERVALCTSGKDAVFLAMRAARTFTGKNIIASFTGSCHGAYEHRVTSHDVNTPSHAPSRMSGMNPQTNVVLPYGHAAALDQILRRKHDLAAVIVEPIRSSNPSAAHTDWLHQLAQTCRDAGVIMILDETYTGFRLAYGGAQELLSLVPDLVTYGDIIGGGLSQGAVAGRADIMGMFFGTATGRTASADGTFAGNPLSISAGIATLRYLREHRATLYPTLNEGGLRLAKGFNAFAAAEQLPVEMKQVGSMFRIVFHRDQNHNHKISACTQSAAEAAFYILALNRGVLMHAAQRGFLSLAHNRETIDEALDVFVESLRDVRDDGLFPAPPKN